MKKLACYTALILIGFSVGFGTGCSKKEPVVKSAAEDASTLPGAAEVMAALNKKDYDGTIAALIQVKAGLTSDEQQVQFMGLRRQVQFKLNEVAATDPKAAEALAAIRSMTMGR